MRRPGLEGIRRLGIVVRDQQVSDPVVEGVIDRSLANPGASVTERPRLQKKLDEFIVATQTCLFKLSVLWPPIRGKSDGAEAYQYQGSIVKLVFGVDVDAATDHLLAFPQVSLATCLEEVAELPARIEGVLFTELAFPDELLLLLDLRLQLVFSNNVRHRYLYSVKRNKAVREKFLILQSVGTFITGPPSHDGD